MKKLDRLLRLSRLFVAGICASNSLWAFGVGERNGALLFGLLAFALVALYIYVPEEA